MNFNIKINEKKKSKFSSELFDPKIFVSHLVEVCQSHRIDKNCRLLREVDRGLIQLERLRFESKILRQIAIQQY